jgi:hypothetical protein
LDGFLTVAGLRRHGRRPSIRDERAVVAPPPTSLPPTHVTF